MGAPVGQPFPKLYPAPEVTRSTPAECKGFNQQIGDTWRPLIGPCVAIPFAANKHITCQLSNNCLPRQSTACHVIVRTDCIVNIHFLPVCHFEQNAISLTLDVCLNPNELRWVFNDKAYALVRFEAIPNTLNF
jgi:hypothetical protein